jgi:hypothetical protein
LQDEDWLPEKSAKMERLSALCEPILNIKNYYLERVARLLLLS